MRKYRLHKEWYGFSIEEFDGERWVEIVAVGGSRRMAITIKEALEKSEIKWLN